MESKSNGQEKYTYLAHIGTYMGNTGRKFLIYNKKLSGNTVINFFALLILERILFTP
jgi:hypothetical protein